MDIHVLAGLGAGAEFTLESTLLEYSWNHLSREKDLFFWPVESRDILTCELFRRVTIQAYALVTSRYVALEISGNDGVVQLVENAGLKNQGALGSARTASFRTSGFLIFLGRRNHG